MKTLGLIGGGGFVGKILRRYFGDIAWIDKDAQSEQIIEVLDRDIIFIAVNFSDNCMGEESKAALHNYFSCLLDSKPRTIVFKSTFVPGTTDYFQNTYPFHRFIYNPEFLTERTAWEDFTRPQYQLLGMTHQSLPDAGELFDLLPEAPVREIISPRDAEMLKHSFNSYYALKVTYFNQLYDTCQRLGADYETVRRLMVKNPYVGDSHSIIYHNGYRGYGGKCLPKDTKAFGAVSGSPLIRVIEEINHSYVSPTKPAHGDAILGKSPIQTQNS